MKWKIFQDQQFQSISWFKKQFPQDLWIPILEYAGISPSQIHEQRCKDQHQTKWILIMHELILDTDRFYLFLLDHFTHWAIDPNGKQLQAISCHVCGNYAMSNTIGRSEKTICFHW